MVLTARTSSASPSSQIELTPMQPSARFFVGELDEDALDRGNPRRTPRHPLHEGSDALRVVGSQRLEKEAPLVAEGVVEALLPDAHRGDEVLGRRTRKALLPEHGDGAAKSDVSIEFLGPSDSRYDGSYGT